MNKEYTGRILSMSKIFYYIILCGFALSFTAGCQLPSRQDQYKDELDPSVFYTWADNSDAPAEEEFWKVIRLESAYAGRWCVAGDIDNDNEIEIVSAKNYRADSYHYTTSVAVFNLDNSILWEWGDPNAGQTECSYDVACQIYDIDNDGYNEVIVGADEKLIVLDGLTGVEKWSFTIPAKASDCIVFADLNGNGRAEDIIVKTRYSTLWAYSKSGTLLWQTEKPGGYRTTHRPFPVDLDSDGKDEIMAGYAMLNPDGTIRWTLSDRDLPIADGHPDSIRTYKSGLSPDQFKFVISGCSDNFIAMIDGTGTVLWKFVGYHFESINIGNVYPQYEGDEIFVDIDHSPWGISPSCLFSGNGELLGMIITDRSRSHALLDWEGNGLCLPVIGQTQSLFGPDGQKKISYRLSGTVDPSAPNVEVFTGYMNNDGAIDIFFEYSEDGCYVIDIFKNPSLEGIDDYELGTGINFTYY